MKINRYPFFFSIFLLCGHPFVVNAEEPDSIVRDLPDFVIKAEQFRRTADGVEVVPNKQQLKHSFSGYDLVRNLMIPGVTVNLDKGEINALGGEVALFIDGMPADMREVRQLRPVDVLKVQYMESPTGKYAGNNVALNFILKKRNSGGYIALDATQRIGYTNGDYNLAGKAYVGNTRYTLFAGTDFSDIKNAETTSLETIHFPTPSYLSPSHLSPFSPIQPHSTLLHHIQPHSAPNHPASVTVSRTPAGDHPSHLRKNSQYAQFRVRNKNDRRTLRATLSFVRAATPEDSEASSLVYSGLESDVPSAVSDKTSSSRSFKYSLGLSGSFNLPREQFLEASASATSTRNHYAYRYLESGEDILSSTSEDYYNFTADVTYVKKFSRGNQFILKLSEFYNVSSANYYGNNESWQHLWSSESLLFAEYMHPLWGIATLRVAPGTSAQFYRLHGKDLVSYVAPRAQIALTVQPAQKQYVQLLALYGNSFPQLSMMSTATQQVNIWHIKRGNPDLKQTGIMRFMAAYGIGIRNVNLQAIAIYNGAYRLPMASYSFESGKLLESWLPDGRWHQLDASLSATWIPASRFNLQATGGWFYNRYSKVADVSTGCWKGNVQAAYYIGDFSINIRMETPVKMSGYDRKTVKSPWRYGLSVSWSHKALRAEAGTNNPFSKHPVYKYTLDSPEYRYSGTTFTPAERASAYIKLSWSFDFGKKTSRDNLSVNRTISTGVIRAE